MKQTGPIPSALRSGEGGELTIGGKTASALVDRAGGTPLFVYDRRMIGSQIGQFRAAMPDEVALHYALKANPYPPLLTMLAQHVDGFDVASAGELDTLRDAGSGGLPISFAGPGKRDTELRAAIADEVTINLESQAEAERALRIAGELGIRPRLAVRVNPPFALKGAGMKMGGLASPFGMDPETAVETVRGIIEADADWRGFHIFAGSQSLDAAALIEAQHATVALAADLSGQAGASPPEINLGGGFGIPYFHGDAPLDTFAVGKALGELLARRPDPLRDTRFAIELGRWLVGEAGVYLTRVIERKDSGGRTFLITDGGLHHMLAASGNFGQLLRRNYPVAVADRFDADPEEEVTVTGCLCTPLDILADQVLLPRAEPGDLVAVFCAGAYGLSASPQAFLSHPPARELLV